MRYPLKKIHNPKQFRHRHSRVAAERIGCSTNKAKESELRLVFMTTETNELHAFICSGSCQVSHGICDVHNSCSRHTKHTAEYIYAVKWWIPQKLLNYWMSLTGSFGTKVFCVPTSAAGLPLADTHSSCTSRSSVAWKTSPWVMTGSLGDMRTVSVA